MRRLLVLTCLFLLSQVAVAVADDSSPFQVIYRQEGVQQGEVTTKSNLMLTVINRSGAEVQDLTVSAVNMNPYFVIDIPILFDQIPDAAQKELLVPAEVPNLFVSTEDDGEVLWRLRYVSPGGEEKTIEIAGDKG